MSTPSLRRLLPTSRNDRVGVALCLLSAAGFGAIAVLTKLAYAAGARPLPLLTVRFALAATILWVLLACSRRARPTLRPSRRLAGAGLGLGALYALESGFFYAALGRGSATAVELLLFTYPALVVVGARVLGREELSGRRLGAVALASAGIALLLLGGGAGAGAVAPAAATLGLAGALAYATYVLAVDRLGPAAGPALLLPALLCTGATVCFAVAAAATDELSLPPRIAPWGWALLLALIGTALPIAAFVAAVGRLGPGRASIVSTIEPAVTAMLAFFVLGDRLGPLQLTGGALLVLAVGLGQLRRRRLGLASPPRVVAPEPPCPTPARPLARRPARRERVGV